MNRRTIHTSIAFITLLAVLGWGSGVHIFAQTADSNEIQTAIPEIVPPQTESVAEVEAETPAPNTSTSDTLLENVSTTPVSVTSTETTNPTEQIPSIVPETSKEEKPKVESGEIDDAIAKMRNHIQSKNLPKVFSDRLDAFEKGLKESPNSKKPERIYLTDVPEEGNSKTPFGVLGGADTVHKKTVSRDEVPKEKNQKTIVPKKRSIPLDTNARLLTEADSNLTFLETAQTQSQTVTYTPTSNTYLTLQNELEESQLIRERAGALDHNPLQILNFVRENVLYEPYYGSKKGAEATLLEGVGNDADQAALLIALLRASDIGARYHHGVVQLSLRDVMDLLGVDNPELAAKILGGANIPYALYYDQNDTPLYFSMELFWVEAYIEYGLYQGTEEPGIGEKSWIPLSPTLVPTYTFQSIDGVEGITTQGFNIHTFFDSYLEGSYGTTTPITAFENTIGTYVETLEEKTLEDAQVKMYRGYNALEYIPPTLPFTIMTDYGTYEYIPETFRHEISFSIGSNTVNHLSKNMYMSDIAHNELLVSYVPATTDDATFLASFNTIYDVVPLSLLRVKPVLTAQGVTVGESIPGTTLTPGTKATLGVTFFAPRRTLQGTLTKSETEHVEKPTLIGSTEAIAIDTGNVMPPEIRPSEDVASASVIQDQILYKTALNYLDRLEASHDRLALYVGGAFTDIATRAIISNSLNVTSVNGAPYSFTWVGLSIDASALVRYHARFGTDVHHNRNVFTHLFGLEASLDEATIFEEDYNVDAVSTVKALRLINQGIIPGEVVKITKDNVSVIDTLSLSTKLKNTLYEAVNLGRVVYVPKAPFTYGLWSGTVYISIDPVSGSGSYVIGEGLNGGYTANEFQPILKKFIPKAEAASTYEITASVETSNSIIEKGKKVLVEITYKIKNLFTGAITTRKERSVIDTRFLPTSKYLINPYYYNGITLNNTQEKEIDLVDGFRLGPKNKTHEFDQMINKYALEYSIPNSILKVLITHESGLNPKAYRYEPCIDRNWYSGTSATVGLERHPEHHWRLRGYNQNGTFYEEGDQVSKLNPSIYEIIKTYSNKAIKYENGDSLYSVWLNNKSTQNYEAFGCNISNTLESANPQFLIAASYGLGQMLYETALNNGFDKIGMSSGVVGRSIYDLFIPEVSIKLAAKKLRNAYENMPQEKRTGDGNECTYDLQAQTGKDWGEAFRIYNGSASNLAARNYAFNRCKEYHSGEFHPY